MTPAPDNPPSWEVVPNFRDRTGVAGYRAPASDSPDPVVVEGHRARSATHAPMMMVVWAVSFAVAILGHSLPVIGFTVAMFAAAIGLTIFRNRFRHSWKVPRLVASSEGLTVSDVLGETHHVGWEDVGRCELNDGKVGPDNVLLLLWTTPSGERTVLDLGDTMDPGKIREAIHSHAPEALEPTSDARLAYDEEGSDE